MPIMTMDDKKRRRATSSDDDSTALDKHRKRIADTLAKLYSEMSSDDSDSDRPRNKIKESVNRDKDNGTNSDSDVDNTKNDTNCLLKDGSKRNYKAETKSKSLKKKTLSVNAYSDSDDTDNEKTEESDPQVMSKKVLSGTKKEPKADHMSSEGEEQNASENENRDSDGEENTKTQHKSKTKSKKPSKEVSSETGKIKYENLASSQHDMSSSESDESSKKPKSARKSSKKKLPDSDNSESKNVKKQKNTPENDSGIIKLKPYLKVAGIHCTNYAKLWANCCSMKAKGDAILELMTKQGLKGQPSIAKCKKLRKKIETKREVNELDVNNIIEESGRPRRSRGLVNQESRFDKDVAERKTDIIKQRFARICDIIESDSE